MCNVVTESMCEYGDKRPPAIEKLCLLNDGVMDHFKGWKVGSKSNKAGFFFVQNRKTQFGILKNPVPQIFQKPSSQPKTQFKITQKLCFLNKYLSNSRNFGKTQISKNPVPKTQKPSFSQIWKA